MVTPTFWLNEIWFVLIAVLLTGYAVLDGFDLGVGVLHLFAKSEEERRTSLRSIGPFWDGNEVWLLAAGGSLFAAFPGAYATVFSGFYLALLLVLVALITRAVSLEYRNAVQGATWRQIWDVAFAMGSLLAALLLGVAAGNILRGVPVGKGGDYQGSFLGLLNPLGVLVGVLVVVTCAMHGATWLMLKAGGALSERMARVAVRLSVAVALLFVAASLLLPRERILPHGPGQLSLRVLGLLAIAGGLVGVFLSARARRALLSFAASSLTIVGMVGLAAVSLYPVLVPSTIDEKLSLTIGNAASTPRTLFTMLVIAGLGMPLVIAYTALIHVLFRGKVSEEKVSGEEVGYEG